LQANIAGCTVAGDPTPTTTGAFEVTNAVTGKVYFSKLATGKYIDNDKEALAALIEAIKSDDGTTE